MKDIIVHLKAHANGYLLGVEWELFKCIERDLDALKPFLLFC